MTSANQAVFLADVAVRKPQCGDCRARWSHLPDGLSSRVLSALIVDPLHNVLFGGVLRTEIDFGGGPLPLLGKREVDFSGFVVKLSPVGDHVFSRNTLMYQVRSIASNGTRAVVSGVELANVFRPRLLLFDAAGTPSQWPGDTSFHSDIGTGDAVALGASGRIWWNTTTRKQFGQSASSTYVLVLRE